MAKEQLHSWSRTVVMIVTLIFVCGITYNNIGHNTKDIDKVETKVEVVEKDVHELQLKDKDLANMAKQSLMFMSQVDTKLDSIITEQTKQSIINAVNSEKLQQLTKE